METAERTPAAVMADACAKIKNLWGTLISRPRVLISAAALLCMVILAAVLLLRPSGFRAGSLSVRSGDTVVDVPGTEILRRLGSSVTEGETVSTEDAPHVTFSDGIELLLDGTLFNEKAYVSVYTEDNEPVTVDSDRLVVPAEAGTYLVSVEAFWGRQSNLVASQHYFWLDVPAAQ